MGRPSKGERVSVLFRLPVDLLASIDALRGDQERMAWIVQALASVVKREQRKAPK